jgi:hypothetical protein
MKSLNQWNHIAHVGSFLLGFGWGGLAVFSGKVGSVSLLAIAIGVVTTAGLIAYAISTPSPRYADAPSEPMEQ